MQNQFGRRGRVLALGTLLTLAGSAVAMAQNTPRPETSLLGITLLKSSYRDVLKHFGRPDEIQAGGPYMPNEGAPSTAQPASGSGSGRRQMMGGPMMGGYPGMGSPGGPGAGGGGKKAISKTGFPGRSGTGAAGPAAAGYPGAPGGAPGAGGGLPGFSGGSSGYPGMPGMGGGSQGYPGMPGMGSSGGGSGSSGYPGMPGMGGGGASGGADANADQSEYEATWWYHDKTNGLHKSFLFNKDGRVIQVQEYGYDKNHKGGKTRTGVGLGSGLNQVLRTYGWSNDGANDGKNIIMRFGGEDKVAFQLVNNVVVGITIAVVKDIVPAEEPQ